MPTLFWPKGAGIWTIQSSKAQSNDRALPERGGTLKLIGALQSNENPAKVKEVTTVGTKWKNKSVKMLRSNRCDRLVFTLLLSMFINITLEQSLPHLWRMDGFVLMFTRKTRIRFKRFAGTLRIWNPKCRLCIRTFLIQKFSLCRLVIPWIRIVYARPRSFWFAFTQDSVCTELVPSNWFSVNIGRNVNISQICWIRKFCL